MKEVKTFQQMHRDGLINRREFLAAMGALGVTAATAGSLLTSASALASTPTRGARWSLRRTCMVQMTPWIRYSARQPSITPAQIRAVMA